MQHKNWLALCAVLAACMGCEKTQQTPSPEAAIQQSQQTLQDVQRGIEEIAAQTKQLGDKLKAYETLRSTGAKVEIDPKSSQVVSVDLHGIEVTDTLATQVALLGGLEKLTINESVMTLAGWQELGTLSALQQLDLRDCPLNNEQLEAIVKGLPKLKALRLNGTSGRTTVDDNGLAVLKGCPELKVLAIDGLWVGGEGLKHLQGNQKLIELYAAGTTVDDAAGELIAKLPALRKLRLSKTSISSTGIASLSALPLEDLDISEASGISDAALEIIGNMKSLKRLNLWRDTVTDAGVEHLAGLTELEWLNLDNTHLADAGLPHLSGMTHLNFLHLGSTGVTDAGMPALASLKSLKDLKVTRTAVTEAGVEVVRQAIPGIDIQLKYIEGE
jgi:hypothetical protein